MSIAIKKMWDVSKVGVSILDLQNELNTLQEEGHEIFSILFEPVFGISHIVSSYYQEVRTDQENYIK